MEASLALAGFAGVVTVLSQRGAGGLQPIHRMSLVNLLATALGALFLSLTALVLLEARVAEPLVWRLTGVAGVLVTVYFGFRSTRTVVTASTEDNAKRGRVTLLMINLPLLLVCLLQLWNVLGPGEFWPLLLLLVALFGVGCYSFVILVFGPAT